MLSVIIIRRVFASASFLLVSALSLTHSAHLIAEAMVADTVLLNARIYTGDEAYPWAEGVAIRDGRFVYVGDSSQARTWVGDNTSVQDLDGALIIPGLIDSHTHPGILSLFASTTMVVAPDSNPGAMLQWLGEYAQANQDDSFIVAGFWRTADFGVGGPDRSDIDNVIGDRPVALLDDSGHSMWLNSRALEVLGVDEKTEDPAPGLAFYERDQQNRPTGWVKEFAMATVQERILAPAETDIFERKLEEFLYFLSGRGVTGLYDAGNLWLHDKVYRALSALDRRGRLPLRYEGTVHVHLPWQLDKAIAELKRLRTQYGSERLRFNTVKIHFDGVNEIRTAAVLEGYADDPENTGGTLISKQRLTRFIRELHNERLDLHLHVVGDRATRIALDAYEDSGAVDWDYPRMTLCHLELVDDADIQRFAALGVIANFSPHWFGDLYQGGAQTLGARNNHKMRARAFVEQGAVVSFSSDVVVPDEQQRADPFFGMQIGITRQEPADGPNAKVMGPENERLDIEHMLRGYTSGGAFQMRRSRDLGSIAPGKYADLVILGQNPFAMNPYDLASIRVKATMIDGKFIHQ